MGRVSAYPVGMAAMLESALASATLNEAERRTVERLVRAFRDELGEDLLAVWLYGSRARGDANPEETDPDLKSDIDLMLIVTSSSGWEPYGGDAIPFITEAAEAEGESPVWYSVLVYEVDRLRDRREIRSFFIQEVDRDKLILHGSALE